MGLTDLCHPLKGSNLAIINFFFFLPSLTFLFPFPSIYKSCSFWTAPWSPLLPVYDWMLPDSNGVLLTYTLEMLRMPQFVFQKRWCEKRTLKKTPKVPRSRVPRCRPCGASYTRCFLAAPGGSGNAPLRAHLWSLCMMSLHTIWTCLCLDRVQTLAGVRLGPT